MAKRIITILLALLGALLAAALAYVAYVMITYERLPDNLALAVDAPLAADEAASVVSADEEFTLVTANLGFGAYNRDFDFFMDGGTGSVAESPEVVREDILGSAEALRALSPDFVLFQEVDTDGTRSHHIDEYELLRTQFPSDWSVFCQNYDSAFLAWPLYAPHGANRAGLATFSRLPVSDPVRKSLPISDSFSKFLDLDRCYSIVRVPAGDAELVLFNVHLSAYGADASIMAAQREKLYEDMTAERAAGNYVIAGGDYNHDMIGVSARCTATPPRLWKAGPSPTTSTACQRASRWPPRRSSMRRAPPPSPTPPPAATPGAPMTAPTTAGSWTRSSTPTTWNASTAPPWIWTSPTPTTTPSP